MRQEDNSIITLCPSIGQFFINELPLLLLCVAMLLIGGLPGCAYSTLLLVFSLKVPCRNLLWRSTSLLQTGSGFATGDCGKVL
jgi:ABC-type uncharacterized transport system permease subunit